MGLTRSGANVPVDSSLREFSSWDNPLWKVSRDSSTSCWAAMMEVLVETLSVSSSREVMEVVKLFDQESMEWVMLYST